MVGLYDISMAEEFIPRKNTHHELQRTDVNLPAPLRDVFGKLSETSQTKTRLFGLYAC
jgi:hypothetical protein